MTLTPQSEIAEHALRKLFESLPDFTDPDSDGHCARLIATGGSVEAGYVSVTVARPGSSSNQEFHVSVVVSPAPQPVGLRPYGTQDESIDRGGVSSRDESGVVRLVPGSGNGA